MAVDHGAPEYVYKQLAAILRARITAGELPPRARVPSLRELEAEFDVAPMTVRRAIQVLADEGWVVTYPGRGTFVADTPPRDS